MNYAERWNDIGDDLDHIWYDEIQDKYVFVSIRLIRDNNLDKFKVLLLRDFNRTILKLNLEVKMSRMSFTLAINGSTGQNKSGMGQSSYTLPFNGPIPNKAIHGDPVFIKF